MNTDKRHAGETAKASGILTRSDVERILGIRPTPRITMGEKIKLRLLRRAH